MSNETTHLEAHSTSSEFVRDAVIGLADGLTVPFALAAGLAATVGSGQVIVVAGLAEIAAGSIAMGLGGYLAARGDEEHYHAERKREEDEIREVPTEEEWEVEELMQRYGATREESRPFIDALRRNPRAWTDFMMRFELGLEEPSPKRAVRSAFTISSAYVIGGLVPLLPYMLVKSVGVGLLVSIATTIVALAVFGAVKSRVTGVPVLRGLAKTVLIGTVAAAAAFLIARLIT